MLKGLALRQSFLVANIFLIILAGGVLALTISNYLAAPLDVGPVSSPTVPSLPGQSAFSSVRPIDEYSIIVQSGLFGNAARYDPKSKPNPATLALQKPASQEETEETKLPLTLLGTQVSGDNDLFAMAIIELKQSGTRTKAFWLGQEVISNVFLLEIRRKEVVLDNKRNDRLETLTVNPAEARGQSAQASRVSSSRRGPTTSVVSRPRTIQLNRGDITKKLVDEYARLASTLDIQVVKDEQGRIQGITTDDIESISVAAELGFQNGDVLTSINNEPVDSREKGAEVIRKYRNASIFRIGILRDGQPLYINYRVR